MPVPVTLLARYSARMLVTGSTRAARAAGIRHAAITTTSRPPVTATIGVDIDCADVVQATPPAACPTGERARDAECEAEQRPLESLAQDESQHAAGRRAERDSHAELARATRDHVREHAVDPDRGEQQRDGGEARNQAEREAPRREAGADDSSSVVIVATAVLGRRPLRRAGAAAPLPSDRPGADRRCSSSSSRFLAMIGVHESASSARRALRRRMSPMMPMICSGSPFGSGPIRISSANGVALAEEAVRGSSR